MLTQSLFLADTSEPVLDLTAGDLLRAAAGDAGDRLAIVEVAPPGSASLTGADRTDRTWSYAQLLADSEACARWLLQRFSPGDRVVVWAPNVPEWVVLQYGAALAGLVLVTANPALPAGELRYVLEQSRAAGLFHAHAFRGTDMSALAAEASRELPELRERFELTRWPELAREAAGLTGDLPAVDPGAPAQIQYTSGTTGFPKGALLHHRGLVTNARYAPTRPPPSAGRCGTSTSRSSTPAPATSCPSGSRARCARGDTSRCSSTSTSRSGRPRRLTPTAGCTPATSGRWTRAATSPSPAASRT